LRPHPHFTRHVCKKKIRKTIRILHSWKSASLQIRILPEAPYGSLRSLLLRCQTNILVRI